MPQIKLYILIFWVGFSVPLFAQSLKSDLELKEIQLENHISLAEFDRERGDYSSSKNHLTKALEIAENLGERKTEGILYTRIAKIQFAIEETENALISLQKSATIQRDLADNLNLAITYNAMGAVHYSLKNYKTALEYFDSAKTKFENESSEDYIAELSLNKAKVYLITQDYKNAKAFLEKAIIISKKHKQQNVLSSALIYYGKTLLKLKNKQLALSSALEGLEIAKSNGYTEPITESYLVLSDIYQEEQNYKLSNEYLRKHVKLTDSLLNIKRQNFLPEKRIQFLDDYQNVENERLEAQQSKRKKDFNLTKITTILSIALITILSLLTLSLYKNNNIRLKTNNMLHKKNDELVVAKEKAELATKTKANFLSTLTHELRTPLYAVTGLSRMLLDENPKPEQVQHLESLKFSGDYLLNFINDILQINKIEANKVELDPEIFNLKDKASNIISALNNSAKNNNISIHFDYDKKLPQVFEGDELKISQILINLIGNAIKFAKGGDIWVRINKLDKTGKTLKVKFEVEDNGIGISKEKQGQLFESFSQGSTQINRKYGGTGLGLSIVKGLIEILQGKIYLKSTLGIGTTFTFEIPLRLVEATEQQHYEDTPKKLDTLDLKNIKILVVEDNKINQMITKKILNKMDLYCEVVDNGEMAVEMVKENHYNVVLMDVHMPGISGIEATKIIRTFDKQLTIFALTAVTIDDKKQEFDDAGFNDVISKPFKQEDFEATLFSALNNQKPKIT